jgi:hypothetical protein
MTQFSIQTKHGEIYRIHENGRIERTDMKLTPSDSWRLLGIKHVTRNEYIQFEQITPALVQNLNLTYKNGNPQYTVVDYDHGTRRMWGNTPHHGITNIWFERS